MNNVIKNIIRFIVFIALQIYLLNKIPHLHRFIIPYLYYLPLLWLPFSMKKGQLMLTGFLLGLTLDYFMMTPGLHAAACLLLAYARPFVISLLAEKNTMAFTYNEPSPKAMQWAPYMMYVFILTLLHHGYMIFLEWLSLGSFIEFLIKVISTTAISMLLIFTTELLFPRKLKFRTNTP